MRNFGHKGTIMVAVNRQGFELPRKELMPSGKRERRNLNAIYVYNTLSDICISEEYTAQPPQTSRIASKFQLQPLHYYLRQ